MEASSEGRSTTEVSECPSSRRRTRDPTGISWSPSSTLAATMAAWLTLSVMALVFGVVAWLVEGYVWPNLRHFFS